MGKCHGDIEMGCHNPAALYPRMEESPALRWGFIRKVYTIITIQILASIAVGACVVYIPPIPEFLLANTPASFACRIFLIFLPLLTMIPMFMLRKKHPWNLIFLGLFTISLSFVVGLGCATRNGMVIFQAAFLTAVVVASLTVYTFWAVKRGHDFSFLGPFLFAASLVLLVYCLMQFFVPIGPVGRTVYSCLIALLASAYIVYDTNNLIKEHDYDEYVSAAVCLYIDIMNLFGALLNLLS